MSTTITARPGTPFIEVTRELTAPPAAVFRAHRAERGEFLSRGVFHSVEDGTRTVQTFEFEGAPVFPSVEARDTALENTMCRGITESYERLGALLGKES